MKNIIYHDTGKGRGVVEIRVANLGSVAKALGDMKDKSPAAIKTAINATARRLRKEMILHARARYAVNAAGERHLKELAQRRKATNRSLKAELYISSLRNDLGYFETSPSRPFMGKDVLKAPKVFTGRVLRSSAMEALTGTSKLSKGFLVEFKSGHVGMVQRRIGTGEFHYTERSGAPSWSEKMRTMPSPGASAMHNAIWYEVEPDTEQYLEDYLKKKIQSILAKAGK